MNIHIDDFILFLFAWLKVFSFKQNNKHVNRGNHTQQIGLWPDVHASCLAKFRSLDCCIHSGRIFRCSEAYLRPPAPCVPVLVYRALRFQSRMQTDKRVRLPLGFYIVALQSAWQTFRSPASSFSGPPLGGDMHNVPTG